MKPNRKLVAARPLAQHCAQLVRPAAATIDPLPELAHAAQRLARAMRTALSPLLGGEVPQVECAAPSDIAAEDFAATGLVAYSAYAAGEGSAPLASAIDAEAVLSLLDRAFGGPGEAPRPLPKELPVSAQLMVERIEAILAAQIGAALGLAAGAIRPRGRDTDLAQLRPFAAGTRLALMVLTVSENGRGAWRLRLAIPMGAIAALMGLDGKRSGPRPGSAGPASPHDAPFNAVPLMLSAVIVDVAMPISAVSRLEVGQVLTVPIARNVPLRVGGLTIGHGSIGAVDDRVAIQFTQLF
jgi:flagellar motor switch protein FliM